VNPVRVDVTGQVCSPELVPFLTTLRNQAGFPYVWPTEENAYSGKGLPGCLYPHGRDCSGTVSFALNACGFHLEGGRGMWSANRYYETAVAEGRVIEHPHIGDQVVYVSPSTGKAIHIETVMEDGRFFGAIGAGSNCTTPEKAKELGACVKYREHPYPEAHGRAVFLRNPLRAA
jgi:hypothetical protein